MPGPGELVVQPDRLDFHDAFVGQRVALEVELSNVGESRLELAVETMSPFDVGSSAAVSLGRGESQRLQVGFRPVAPGPVEGVLRVAGREVSLVGLGREPPTCAARVCERATFDFSANACVAVAEPVGAPCASRCVMAGQCRAVGQCEGAGISCDDGDVCTADACIEESGRCGSTPRQCPSPVSPCQRAVCRSPVGCVTEDVDDGELCGVDDCRSTTVDVCISGRCVTRARPAAGRCSNRWVAATLPNKSGAVFGFDPANRRHVLFGGQGGADTWAWDGARWTQLFSAAAPGPGFWNGVFDGQRGRLLLAGGQNDFETWEWSGQTWIQRHPANAPPVSRNLALAHDARRARVVLFGAYRPGRFPPLSDETWEWDGVTWTRMTPPRAPGARDSAALFFDGQRIILFGGWNGERSLDDVWAWDGQQWESLNPPRRPPARSLVTAVRDVARDRVLLTGGFDSMGVGQTDTWEWDGTSFTEVSGPNLGGRVAASWDDARRQLVVCDAASGATWEGSSQRLQLVSAPLVRPPGRVAQGWVWDEVAGHALLFGGSSGGTLRRLDTWSWDGRAWTQRADAGPAGAWFATATDPNTRRPLRFGGSLDDGGLSDLAFRWEGAAWAQLDGSVPPPRSHAVMATDPRRGRTVLFGGDDGRGVLADTWEFDGARWRRVETDGGPPARRSHVMAFDPSSGEVVLFGGNVEQAGALDDTWRFDGQRWAALDASVRPPARRDAALAFDPTLGGLVLTGGSRLEPNGSVLSFNQTWLLRGSTWTNLDAEASWVDWSPSLTFDSVRGRLSLLSESTVWWYLP